MILMFFATFVVITLLRNKESLSLISSREHIMHTSASNSEIRINPGLRILSVKPT